MRGWMTAAACAAVVLASGCAGLFGSGENFSALQASCQAATDYGADAQSVNAALADAYVAYRHARLSATDYCAFARDLASHYRTRAAGGPDSARAWADYFNAQRVKAIDWRAQVDPTLRGG